jgi:hypothetical protein
MVGSLSHRIASRTTLVLLELRSNKDGPAVDDKKHSRAGQEQSTGMFYAVDEVYTERCINKGM